MAMSGSGMGDSVWTAVKAVIPASGTPITDAQGRAIWEAACTAIVAHIEANMVVTVQLTAVPVTGGAGGAVTGTAANVAGSGIA